MKIAIHQPNFMPWGGFFYKLLRSDIFIFFDTVQYPRGKSFCNRVMIKNSGGPQWLTVPVEGKGKQLPIMDVPIAAGNWMKKHLGTIKGAYGKAPHFNKFFVEIENIYNTTSAKRIADLNIHLITYLASALKAKTTFYRASQLKVSPKGTGDYILALVRDLGGTVYLTGRGKGTKRHLDEKKFRQSGIEVEQITFTNPRYPQLWGDFLPGLSVLDILFNTGPQARDIILSGGSQ